MQPPDEPRFLVDAMLVKLGKYLRCLGYDATWDGSLPTRELALRADREERVFLTRNRRVGQGIEPPAETLLLPDQDPVSLFHRVVEALDLDPRGRLFSRCIRCNVRLEELAEPTLARGRVPEGVLARYRRFYSCPACATVFWKGTHVRNTCRKLGLEPPQEER